MSDPNTVEVTVKTLDSQSRSYAVRGDLTVKQFKEHISSSVGIPVDKQRLIYQGRVLQDEKTLNEYNVDGKVIHLVERAPPQTVPSEGGAGGVSGSADGAMPPNSSASTPQGTPHAHDRNGNSYVMLGTFNLPMNIMNPQQIQVSMQQMMSGLGESGRSARVSTTGSSGSVDVHIDMDQSMQSEPRLRLSMAENMLRDTNALLCRLENQSSGSSQQDSAATPSSSSTPSPSAQPMDTSPTAPPPAPPSSSSSSTQTEGPPFSGPHHPRPAELVEVLSELRRVEERLQPFLQRTHSILDSAASADYNNNTQEREEDQRILNLVGEALRPLGSALLALSDLRCNLLAPPPRHLHLVRPISHYTSPVMLPGGLHHIPIPINLGSTVAMTTNGRQAAQDESQPNQSTDQSEHQGQEQVPPQQSASANRHPGQGHPGPRMIRISHQTVEPVVMMQMNLDDSGRGAQTSGQPNTAAAGQAGPVPPVHVPGLPPEFMQAIMQQVTQQAVAMAAVASAGQQAASDHGVSTDSSTSTSTAASTPPTAPPPPPQARVVITRPSFMPHVPLPNLSTRGPTINVRAAAPPSAAQHPGQVISALVGQLLMPVQMADHTSSSTSTQSFSSSSSSTSTSTFTPQPVSSASTSGQTATSTTSTTSTSTGQPSGSSSQPQEGIAGANMAQLLSSLLAGGAGAGGRAAGSGAPTSITVTMPGVPVFIQGVSDFIQATQPGFSPSPTGPQHPPASATPTPTPATAPSPTPSSTAHPSSAPAVAVGGPGETISPDLFSGIVQGVLSTMMGSLGGTQNNTESIAQFIQRLSQTSNIFTPGTGDASGFFSDLLALVCQNLSLLDLVLLLHGQHQPLSRIQPQLNQFFTEHLLHGREPSISSIAEEADELINELEGFITESFATVTVMEGVDITQTNTGFFRQQFTRIATHILRCTDHSFGPGLLRLCNQTLFECLALNLYCLGGEQTAVAEVINHRIRNMSADMNPSLVNWLTGMMSMRLQVILEHIPVTEDQIVHYVVRTQGEDTDMEESRLQHIQETESHDLETDRTLSPAPATTAEEAMVSSGEVGPARLSPVGLETVGGVSLREARGGGAMAAAGRREESGGEAEPWAAAVPPEWVPIIRNDLISQRKIKAQPPLSDAYLHGMPAKRRKTVEGEGPLLTLSEAVSQAARSAGVRPVSAPGSLQAELESSELQEAYAEQVKSDIKKRVREDPDFDTEQFPNTQRAFSLDP